MPNVYFGTLPKRGVSLGDPFSILLKKAYGACGGVEIFSEKKYFAVYAASLCVFLNSFFPFKRGSGKFLHRLLLPLPEVM